MLKTIYKMSASWCGPCRVYAPIFVEVSKMDEFKDIEFKELDADDDEDLFEKYRVMSVPTTVFLDENGNVLNKVSGAMPKNTLVESIKKLMK